MKILYGLLIKRDTLWFIPSLLFSLFILAGSSIWHYLGSMFYKDVMHVYLFCYIGSFFVFLLIIVVISILIMIDAVCGLYKKGILKGIFSFLTILLIFAIPLVSYKVSIGRKNIPVVAFLNGMRDAIKTKEIDMNNVQSWLGSLNMTERIKIDMMCYHDATIKVPEDILKLFPNDIIIKKEEEKNIIILQYGGPFQTFGVVIGVNSLELPMDDSNVFKYRLDIDPHAFVWSSE